MNTPYASLASIAHYHDDAFTGLRHRCRAGVLPSALVPVRALLRRMLWLASTLYDVVMLTHQPRTAAARLGPLSASVDARLQVHSGTPCLSSRRRSNALAHASCAHAHRQALAVLCLNVG